MICIVNIDKGHRVRVNKDIHRVAYWEHGTMEVIPGVIVPAQIPTHVLYAKKGEEGVVLETFRSTCAGGSKRGAWYAKVLMIDEFGNKAVNTFRLTSLEKIDTDKVLS